MKVILNYDPATGQIKDKNGDLIYSWVDLQYEEAGQEVNIDSIVKLKNAGFTAEEIIELKRKEVI